MRVFGAIIVGKLLRRVICLFFLVVCAFFLSPNLTYADEKGAVRPQLETRKLSFPAKRSVGSLLLLRPGKEIRTANNQLAGAQGDVTVNIPSGNSLVFEPNQFVFLHPELLDNVSVSGVDALKISFLSMETKEERLCDNLLGHLSKFTNVTVLSVADSDATDEGLKAVSGLVHLKKLGCNQSAVRGTFLTNPSRLSEVISLDIGSCAIGAENFEFLSKLKNLRKLCANKQLLNGSKLIDISLCNNLTELDISQNLTIDDTCVKTILRMKALQSLNISETSISVNGVKQLQALKLQRIWLPKPIYTEKELAALRKCFGASIKFNFNKMDRVVDSVFSPSAILK